MDKWINIVSTICEINCCLTKPPLKLWHWWVITPVVVFRVMIYLCPQFHVCLNNLCLRKRHPLRWRRNGHSGVSNHQPHHCLLNRLFGCRSKKTSKLRVTGLCAPHKWPVTPKMFPFDDVIMPTGHPRLHWELDDGLLHETFGDYVPPTIHHMWWFYPRSRLTHPPPGQMAAISQTMFSDAFSWMTSFVFWLKFHFVPKCPLDNNPALS